MSICSYIFFLLFPYILFIISNTYSIYMRKRSCSHVAFSCECKKKQFYTFMMLLCFYGVLRHLSSIFTTSDQTYAFCANPETHPCMDPKPTHWLHDPCLEFLTVHGNALRMFWAKVSSLPTHSRTTFNVFSSDAVCAMCYATDVGYAFMITYGSDCHYHNIPKVVTVIITKQVIAFNHFYVLVVVHPQGWATARLPAADECGSELECLRLRVDASRCSYDLSCLW